MDIILTSVKIFFWLVYLFGTGGYCIYTIRLFVEIDPSDKDIDNKAAVLKFLPHLLVSLLLISVGFGFFFAQLEDIFGPSDSNNVKTRSLSDENRR